MGARVNEKGGRGRVNDWFGSSQRTTIEPWGIAAADVTAAADADLAVDAATGVMMDAEFDASDETG